MGADAVKTFAKVRTLCKAKKMDDETLRYIAHSLTFIDKETRDTNGHGLVHIAAAVGHADLMSFLLDNGLRVNFPTRAHHGHWASALYMAVVNGSVECVRILLDRNASISPVGRTGISPFFRAATAGHEEIVVLLLAKNANANDTSCNGKEQPVLQCVAQYAKFNPIARLLLAHGAVVTATDARERTALHLAALGGNHELAKVLLDAGAVVGALCSRGRTPIALALDEGKVAKCGEVTNPADDIQVALRLVERGASLDYVDKDGSTLLHYAAQRGSQLICDFLVERGADVHAKAKDGRTPLHMAASGLHLEVVTDLLDKGADVNGGIAVAAGAEAATAPTPFLYALAKIVRSTASGAFRRSLSHMERIVSLCNLFLDRGCSIEGRTGVVSWTALHFAAVIGDMGVVRRLLDMGADVNAVAKGRNQFHEWVNDGTAREGQSALHVAICRGQGGVAAALIGRGADVNAADRDGTTPLMAASRRSDNDDVAIATALLDAGANLNPRDCTGCTALAAAVWAQNDKLAMFLVKRGANVNAADFKGRTPLMHLFRRKPLIPSALATATALLDAGANANAVSHESETSRTALHYAIFNMDAHMNVALVKLLLDRGADVSTANSRGSTALHLATEGHYKDEAVRVELIKFLLSRGADPVATNDMGQRPSWLAGLYAPLMEAFLLEEEDKRMHNPGFKRACLTDLRGPESEPASSSSSSGGGGNASAGAAAATAAAGAGAVDTSDDDDDDDDDDDEED